MATIFTQEQVENRRFPTNGDFWATIDFAARLIGRSFKIKNAAFHGSRAIDFHGSRDDAAIKNVSRNRIRSDLDIIIECRAEDFGRVAETKQRIIQFGLKHRVPVEFCTYDPDLLNTATDSIGPIFASCVQNTIERCKSTIKGQVLSSVRPIRSSATDELRSHLKGRRIKVLDLIDHLPIMPEGVACDNLQSAIQAPTRIVLNYVGWRDIVVDNQRCLTAPSLNASRLRDRFASLVPKRLVDLLDQLVDVDQDYTDLVYNIATGHAKAKEHELAIKRLQDRAVFLVMEFIGQIARQINDDICRSTTSSLKDLRQIQALMASKPST